MKITLKVLKTSGKIIALFLTSILLISCQQSFNSVPIEKKKSIALIVKMKYGDYWKTVKMGAEVAAKEFDVDLMFYAPDNEEDIEGQIQLVNNTIKTGMNAIVLASSNYERLGVAVDLVEGHGIPVIAIDSEVNSTKIKSFIGTDNYNAGKEAGKKLIDLLGPKGNIAVMSFVSGASNAELREKGLFEVVSEYPEIKVAARVYCNSDVDLARSLTQQIVASNSDLDCIIALNAISSIGVARAVKEMNLENQIKVITFDSTPEELDLLQDGVIRATIIQNPFSMGYLGIKYAVETLDGKNIPQRIDTGTKIIDLNNMFTPENQKILFPFVK
ncbi:MAG: LacI family transcriptional regulator [Clostridia bacterium]|jgi:ribose transport system substrate-binding protein|nr:LacI family transcriptional regulator [Clostridia bacterium]